MNGAVLLLSLTVHAGPVSKPNERFPVTAVFTNISSSPVRMLTVFDPLPVFFTASAMAASGTRIDIAGMGKMDPLDGTLTYAELWPGETLEAPLDLAPWIRGEVVPGTYRLSLQYHNAYGSDCFRGILDGEPTVVHVGHSEQP